MFGKRKAAALVAEFLGTGVLTLLILSVQRSQIGLPFFVAIGAGITIAVMTFTFGSNSGGHFNPAITLAMWTARKISAVRGLLYIVAQFVGAYAAFGLYTYFSGTHLTNVGGHFTGKILVAETAGTALFALGYAATQYKNLNWPARAAFAGTAYTVGVVAASTAALGLLNPAVALGIKSWVWGTYVLGPVIGAIIGINLYAYLFAEPEAAVAGVTVPARAASTTTVTPAKKSSAKKKSKK